MKKSSNIVLGKVIARVSLAASALITGSCYQHSHVVRQHHYADDYYIDNDYGYTPFYHSGFGFYPIFINSHPYYYGGRVITSHTLVYNRTSFVNGRRTVSVVSSQSSPSGRVVSRGGFGSSSRASS